ncbi:cell division protein FtsQ/DivIB [Paraferrimonas sedimenticola]|uniref:Cell division protein FtsQ n=1 Tax=Paraferrimonas sedimenticola TaxID=375674 RepID=A0AA37VZ81_9GAMM|nr:cell division protein FtsQ/DivIB [Paraferrimonas sedimenticola]GLP97496.1 cell division protein FtsQ [Paraferrimonas sedimenticola]
MATKAKEGKGKGKGQPKASTKKPSAKASTPIRWSLWLGLGFLLSVIVFLSGGAWKLAIVLQDADALPIEAVGLKGERRFTQDQEVREALQDLMLSSFFTADVDQVRQTLTELPWVYRATVRREWPRQLKVHLIEQHPVARWQGEPPRWLNDKGEVFVAPEVEGVQHLPQLAGPDKVSEQVLEAYQQVSELLRQNGFEAVEMTLSDRQSWQLTLARGIELRLGRKEKMERVQRFINVYPILENEPDAIGYVDLRYDTGLAVGWQN